LLRLAGDKRGSALATLGKRLVGGHVEIGRFRGRLVAALTMLLQERLNVFMKAGSGGEWADGPAQEE
jgi:hypothetical protein